ncbi:FK506-binding protein 1 [Seminavis robusta]|uniref:peptidylprolyl isomerase n=1 Tax=Seminavis robusta TaxID=568900 RepID=A0A9N8DET2_9STRA|nr:FK506-binding protein 1 [Seminavis robusta]|eukprot:Sro55_g032460.1 FK506-binding protein 1 (153) ;mRNA; r:122581-123138
MTEESASIGSANGNDRGSNSHNNSRPEIADDDLIANKQGAGILMRTLEKGHGSRFPKKGEHCQIRFEGRLENGTVIASSKHQKSALQFELGKQHVLEGLEVAVEHMCVGQKVEVTIPPLYAYGHQGFPPKIPPRSTLIFVLELVDVISSDKE